MPRTISRAAYAQMFGPTTGDKVRLADTELVIEVEREFYVEEAGQDEAGVALYRIYYRAHDPDGGGDPPSGAPAIAARA